METYLLICGKDKENNKDGRIHGFVKKSENEFTLAGKYTYEEFFGYLEKRLEEKSHIESLGFRDGRIILLDFIFDEGKLSYSSKGVEYIASFELTQDEEFNRRVERLQRKYEAASEETKTNIAKIKAEIDEKKKFLERFKKSIETYFKTGQIAESDRVFNEASKDFILNNKDKVVKVMDEKAFRVKRPYWNRFWRFFDQIFGGLFLIATGGIIFAALSPLFYFLLENWFVLKLSLAVAGISGSLGLLSISSLPEKIRKMPIKGLSHEFLEALERRIEKSDNPVITMKESDVKPDVYLDCLNRAYNYMRKFPDGVFLNELLGINELIFDYASAKKEEMTSGTGIEKLNFLKRLTKLEIAIYSKSIEGVPRRKPIEDYMMMGLEERLEFLGLPSRKNINDSTLKDIFETIKRVLSFPYERCEDDIVELFALAQEYVKNAQVDSEPKGYGLTNVSQEAIKKLAIIEERIKVKISEFIDAENLSGDLATIGGYLGTLGITGEKEKTPKGDDGSIGKPIGM